MTLFPVFYFAPAEYYSLLLKSDAPLFEIREHFIKQTYRNRCCIYGANGKLDLIIPVRHTGERTLMKEAKIANETNWQKIHWRSVEAAYRTSSYFEYYEHIFAPYYERQFDFLLDFNFALMEEILKILTASSATPKGESEAGKILSMRTEAYKKNYPEDSDLRNHFSPKRAFHSNGKNSEEVTYPQVFSGKFGFIPDLSIIDLIFNMGSSSSNYLSSLLVD